MKVARQQCWKIALQAEARPSLRKGKSTSAIPRYVQILTASERNKKSVVQKVGGEKKVAEADTSNDC